jgi:uncharacterized protein DUF6843
MNSHVLQRAALTSALAVFVVGCPFGETRVASRYLIPKGYVGWVRLEMGVDGAPPATLHDGLYEFQFPVEGLLKTSSRMESGWAKDQYSYYSSSGTEKLRLTGWGEGGSIWGGVVEGSGKRTAEMFFVGTEQQYRGWQNTPFDSRGSEPIRRTGSLEPLPRS